MSGSGPSSSKKNLKQTTLMSMFTPKANRGQNGNRGSNTSGAKRQLTMAEKKARAERNRQQALERLKKNGLKPYTPPQDRKNNNNNNNNNKNLNMNMNSNKNNNSNYSTSRGNGSNLKNGNNGNNVNNALGSQVMNGNHGSSGNNMNMNNLNNFNNFGNGSESALSSSNSNSKSNSNSHSTSLSNSKVRSPNGMSGMNGMMNGVMNGVNGGKRGNGGASRRRNFIADDSDDDVIVPLNANNNKNKNNGKSPQRNGMNGMNGKNGMNEVGQAATARVSRKRSRRVMDEDDDDDDYQPTVNDLQDFESNKREDANIAMHDDFADFADFSDNEDEMAMPEAKKRKLNKSGKKSFKNNNNSNSSTSHLGDDDFDMLSTPSRNRNNSNNSNNSSSRNSNNSNNFRSKPVSNFNRNKSKNKQNNNKNQNKSKSKNSCDDDTLNNMGAFTMRNEASSEQFGEESYKSYSRRMDRLADQAACAQAGAGASHRRVSDQKWYTDPHDKNGKKPGEDGYDCKTLRIPERALKKMTPAQQKYWLLKSDHYDGVLFFKVGKFYELYSSDAELGHALFGLEMMRGAEPHVGFPESSYKKYAEGFVQNGYKVYRVEQMETVEQQKERKHKLVDRAVCEVVSKGTCVEPDMLGDAQGSGKYGKGKNILLSVVERVDEGNNLRQYGVCFGDVSVAQFEVGWFEDDRNRTRLRTLLVQLRPAEVICVKGELSTQTLNVFKSQLRDAVKTPLLKTDYFYTAAQTKIRLRRGAYWKRMQNGLNTAGDDDMDYEDYEDYKDPDESEEQRKVRIKMEEKQKREMPALLENLINDDRDLALHAIGGIVGYLENALLDKDVFIQSVWDVYDPTDLTQDGYLMLDGETLSNLNILENEDTGGVEGSLFHFMDRTATAFGKRQFREWLRAPLNNIEKIEERLDAIDYLKDENLCQWRDEVRRMMMSDKMHDIERLLSRISALGRKRRMDCAVMFDAAWKKSKVEVFLRVLEALDLIINRIIPCFQKHISKQGDGVPPLIKKLTSFAPDTDDKDELGKLGKLGKLKGKDENEKNHSKMKPNCKNNNNSSSSSDGVMKGRNGSNGSNGRGGGNEAEMLSDENGCIPRGLGPILRHFKNWFEPQIAIDAGKIVPRAGCNDEYDRIVEELDLIKKELKMEMKQIKRDFGSEFKIGWWHPSKAKTCKDRYQVEFTVKKGEVVEVPDDWKRLDSSQTKKRFHTKEIEDLLHKLYKAQLKEEVLLMNCARSLFSEFASYQHLWRQLVDAMAQLDCIMSLSMISDASNAPCSMCRPVFVRDDENMEPTDADDNDIDLIDINSKGRKEGTEGQEDKKKKESKGNLLELKGCVHPVLVSYEQESLRGNKFIPNNTIMGGGENEAPFIIVTGPNMGGKSTLLRQTCIAVIMAHMGCYVAASECRLNVVDRIFTRVGANDRILAGQSTFMVELEETSNILAHATSRSLVILDELGRGTSTFDGTSIAYSVAKHLIDKIGCRCLFSTHYHGLTEAFEEEYKCKEDKVAMYHMGFDSDARSNRVTFLYEFRKGVCKESHGVNCARMAGIAPNVLQNAQMRSQQMHDAMHCTRNEIDNVKDDFVALLKGLMVSTPNKFVENVEKFKKETNAGKEVSKGKEGKEVDMMDANTQHVRVKVEQEQNEQNGKLEIDD